MKQSGADAFVRPEILYNGTAVRLDIATAFGKTRGEKEKIHEKRNANKVYILGSHHGNYTTQYKFEYP